MRSDALSNDTHPALERRPPTVWVTDVSDWCGAGADCCYAR
jgi:hypothetical protein